MHPRWPGGTPGSGPTLTRPRQARMVPAMALHDLARLFWFRLPERGTGRPPVPRWKAPTRIYLGMRVQLRMPIASPHTTWVPEGAAGIVVGGNLKRRQVSVELDKPRTVITVPWAWVEEERDTPETPPLEGTPPA